MVYIPSAGGEISPILVFLIIAAVVSVVPLLRWNELGPFVMRHPVFLAADLVLAMLILTVTGPESPFYYFTLATALLSGVLYRWKGATLFSCMLLAAYWAGLWLRSDVVQVQTSYQIVFGIPGLYPIAAAGGAAVRDLLERRAQTESALGAEQERTRLAREMHDSLAKTIQGIALSAAALARWIERDPQRARREAAALGRAAETAAEEARDLIRDLRRDTLDASLPAAVTSVVDDWRARSGVGAICEVDPRADGSSRARWEVLSILRESLDNIERHSRAGEARVVLRADGDFVRLDVGDDGVGLDVDVDFDRLADRGHFGLVGMAERARSVGGRLEVSRQNGGGVKVTAWVPSTAGRSAEVAEP